MMEYMDSQEIFILSLLGVNRSIIIFRYMGSENLKLRTNIEKKNFAFFSQTNLARVFLALDLILLKPPTSA